MKRFDMAAATHDEAARYFANRAVQGLAEGYRWTGDVERLVSDGVEWGARTFVVGPDDTRYQSVYVLAALRGQRRLSTFAVAAANEAPFITTPNCDLEDFFRRKHITHVVVGRFAESKEYRAIAADYGDRRARRSGVFLMNHIDEGLAVLRWIGASDEARRAYCLHPLVQADEDLGRTFPRVAELTDDPRVLCLALEYRSVANAYLSHRQVASEDEIALGPLEGVRQMLVADKVQNYKDFVLAHRGRHARSAELERYFDTWLRKLGVARAQLARWFEDLQADPRTRVSLGQAL